MVQGLSDILCVSNENGLHSLICHSKLPNAKSFKRWVTSEVLPTIRKTVYLKLLVKHPTLSVSKVRKTYTLVVDVVRRMDALTNPVLGEIRDTGQKMLASWVTGCIKGV